MLSLGITVVLDRYFYSGIAYSMAKGLPFAWCLNSEVGLPEPDLCLFLDLNVEECQKRGSFGEERYETFGFQQKVYEMFNIVFDHFPRVVLDANQVPDRVLAQAISLINASKPMRTLGKVSAV